MATSLFPGNRIDMCRGDGLTFTDAVITSVDIQKMDSSMDVIYIFEVTTNNIVFFDSYEINNLLAPSFSGKNDYTIKIDGREMPAHLISYQMTEPHVHMMSEECSSQMIGNTPMVTSAVFSIAVVQSELESGEICATYEHEEDVPIDNRWEILDL